jgi:hypothetical protein
MVILIVVFVIFIVFLLSSLIFTLKIALNQLRRTVLENKILIKLIPIQELHAIKKKQEKELNK